MKTILGVYCLGVSWTCGWLMAFFGPAIAIGSGVALSLPIVIAWRLRNDKGRLSGKATVLATLVFIFAIAGVSFLTWDSFRARVHLECALRRQVATCQRKINGDHRFSNVRLEIVRSKGLDLIVRGDVATERDLAALNDALDLLDIQENKRFYSDFEIATVAASEVVVKQVPR